MGDVRSACNEHIMMSFESIESDQVDIAVSGVPNSGRTTCQIADAQGVAVVSDAVSQETSESADGVGTGFVSTMTLTTILMLLTVEGTVPDGAPNTSKCSRISEKQMKGLK